MIEVAFKQAFHRSRPRRHAACYGTAALGAICDTQCRPRSAWGNFSGHSVPDLTAADKSGDNISVLKGSGLGGIAPPVKSPFAVKVTPPPLPPLPSPPALSFAVGSRRPPSFLFSAPVS